jgi:hypothetical protein
MGPTGLPIQMDSLYLPGSCLTDFQCVPLGGGLKAVHVLDSREFEREYPGD